MWLLLLLHHFMIRERKDNANRNNVRVAQVTEHIKETKHRRGKKQIIKRGISDGGITENRYISMKREHTLHAAQCTLMYFRSDQGYTTAFAITISTHYHQITDAAAVEAH